MRQTEGLLSSIILLLGLELASPTFTLSRRAETLQVSLRPRSGAEPTHLLVDSTGLKLCGSGEWQVEKHGAKTRRSWRKLHIGVDADTGQIVAAELTANDVDDGSQVGSLLDQVAGRIGFVYWRRARTIETTSTAPSPNVILTLPSSCRRVRVRCRGKWPRPRRDRPTQRDLHLQLIAERGRMAWQKAFGYNFVR